MKYIQFIYKKIFGSKLSKLGIIFQAICFNIVSNSCVLIEILLFFNETFSYYLVVEFSVHRLIADCILLSTIATERFYRPYILDEKNINAKNLHHCDIWFEYVGCFF